MPPNTTFESAPTFVAAQTADGWIDGSAAGSATNNAFGWWASPRATGIAVKFDTVDFHSGTRSLKISTTDITGRARISCAKQSAGNLTAGSSNSPFLVRCVPNANYTLTAWVKTNNVATGSATIALTELNASFAVGTNIALTSLTGTNAWALVTASGTTTSTGAYLAVGMANDVAGNISDAWFDDMLLSGPTGYNFTMMGVGA